jgi:hypothetical protein
MWKAGSGSLAGSQSSCMPCLGWYGVYVSVATLRQTDRQPDQAPSEAMPQD